MVRPESIRLRRRIPPRFGSFLILAACGLAVLAPSAGPFRSTARFHPPAQPRVVDSLAGLSAEARVSPLSAPIGGPFEFHLTLTNTRAETFRFVVDGCPVTLVVDGSYSPFRACAEFAREIVLEPGESVTFGPLDDAGLRFDPHRYPLGPGGHRAALMVPGVAADEIGFLVQAPSPDLAYAAGQVVREDGSVLRWAGTATLRGYPDKDGHPGPTYETPLGDYGHFLFDGVDPGLYGLRIDTGGETWISPEGAPYELHGGTYVDGIPVVLPPLPPWPPVYEVSGTVYSDCVECEAPNGPLSGAVVLAIPGRRAAWTDEQGRFTLELPEGAYRLVAGRLGSHRYQYWDHVASFDRAGFYPVPSRVMAPGFDLPHAWNLPSGIAGTVLVEARGKDEDEMLPRPLSGALVRAVPVLPSHPAEVRSWTAETGPDGTYRMDVPADSPYLMSASAPGFETQFFLHARSPEDATWVDVAPGRTRDGVDFLIRAGEPPYPTGAVEGAVYRVLAGRDCGDGTIGSDGTRCAEPVAGALIRVVPAYRTPAPAEFRAWTGLDGRFRVEDIPADPDGRLAYFISAQVENAEAIYHPGGVGFPDAEPVPVLPGGVVDIGVLRFFGPGPGEDGLVGGRITDPEGNPIAEALVRVYLDPRSPWGRVARTRSGPDGAFHLGGLPAGIGVLVSAEAPGFVPAYHPGVFRWRAAERVYTGGPNARVAPVHLALHPASTGGPFIQAGLVVAAHESSGVDSGWVEPEPLSGGFASFRAKLTALSRGIASGSPPGWDLGIRDAFFYVAHAEAMGPLELPVAGAAAGDNGAVILTGLHEGTYLAFADRPGFESRYFRDASGRPVPLVLNGATPAVLARIGLPPVGIPPGGEAGATMLTGITNVPNPFRPETAIRYSLGEPRSVTIRIFDAQGRLVRSLLEEAIREAGDWEIRWDGRDASGRRVSPGVYYAHIHAGPETMARKMVLLD